MQVRQQAYAGTLTRLPNTLTERISIQPYRSTAYGTATSNECTHMLGRKMSAISIHCACNTLISQVLVSILRAAFAQRRAYGEARRRSTGRRTRRE